jgi:hypothetical protein
MSGYHRKVFLQWSDEAEANDQLEEFYLEWKLICHKLQTKPVRWGDPQYDLKYSNMRVFRGISKHFIVHYAIDFDLREVIIKDLFPRSGSGFQLPPT